MVIRSELRQQWFEVTDVRGTTPNKYSILQKFLKIQEDAKHLQKHSFKKFLKRVWAEPSVSFSPNRPAGVVETETDCDGFVDAIHEGVVEMTHFFAQAALVDRSYLLKEDDGIPCKSAADR